MDTTNLPLLLKQLLDSLCVIDGDICYDCMAVYRLRDQLRATPTAPADLASFLASEIECEVFEKYVAPALSRYDAAQQAETVGQQVEDAHLYRQWFETVQDCNGGYLNPADYFAAKRLYELLGMRVPASITNVTGAAIAPKVQDHSEHVLNMVSCPEAGA